MFGLLATMLASHATVPVLAKLHGDEFARKGIIAELVERPAGISGADFAQRLIDSEGLRPWNGKQLNLPARNGGMAVKAVYSADGREIHVSYVETDTKRPGRVCRTRFARGGVSPERWKSIRWCASAFGIQLSATPPPPVVVTSEPTTR